MSEPDGFRQLMIECPRCGTDLSEWMEQCPECGQNLFEVYAGTYRPRRSLWMRLVSLVLLLIMIGGLVMAILAVRRSWRATGPAPTTAPVAAPKRTPAS